MKTQWMGCFLSTLFFVAAVNAADNTLDKRIDAAHVCLLQEQDDDNRVPVGDRRISQEEHVATQEKRSRMAAEHGVQSAKDADLIHKGCYTSHQGAFHRPQSITLGGDMVFLEDGSGWMVRQKDRYKTLDWLAGDTIVILPNHGWFSSYYYVLENRNTGAQVSVNLALGPIYNGNYTHWIVAIDYYNGNLCLDDGSMWRISSSDSETVKKWLPNDTIIMGVNDSWFSSKPNILINVNTLTYAAAICEN